MYEDGAYECISWRAPSLLHIEQGCWMVTTGQTSGYHTISVQPQFWRFLGLSYKELDYVSPSLAFGMGGAPFYFYRVGTTLQLPLRMNGLIRITMVTAAGDINEHFK